MAIYTCVEKKVNNHGVALSYILSNEAGQLGEFNRETVLLMLNNRNNKFTNLKLTSDNKIIFTNNEDVRESSAGTLRIHPSTSLAMLILNLTDKNNISMQQAFVNQYNEGFAQSLSSWIEQIESGIAPESFKHLTDNHSMIRVDKIYKNKSGRVIGYEITNKGDCSITFQNTVYDLSMGYREVSSSTSVLNKGKSVIINKLDAIRLISQPGFGGMWNNALLRTTSLGKHIVTPLDFLDLCRLDVTVKEVRTGNMISYLEYSLGLRKAESAMNTTQSTGTSRKGLLGLFRR